MKIKNKDGFYVPTPKHEEKIKQHDQWKKDAEELKKLKKQK